MRLTVKQAAERAGVSAAIVYSWVASKVVPCYRLGRPGRRGKVLIDDSDLDAFLRGHRQAQPEAKPAPPPAPRLTLNHLKR